MQPQIHAGLGPGGCSSQICRVGCPGCAPGGVLSPPGVPQDTGLDPGEGIESPREALRAPGAVPDRVTNVTSSNGGSHPSGGYPSWEIGELSPVMTPKGSTMQELKIRTITEDGDKKTEEIV